MIVRSINPLRIRETGTGANPLALDVRTQRIEYSKGIYPTDFYPDSIGSLFLQVEQEAGKSFSETSLYDDDNNFIQTIPNVNITPVGWVGNSIYSIRIPAQSEGRYYLKVVESGVTYLSDIYKQSNNNNDIVSIKYTDVNNSQGVFYSSTALIWQPTAYYTGQVLEDGTDDELTVSESYLGNDTLTRAVTKFTDELILTDIGTAYMKVVKLQLTRTNVFINDGEYVVTNIETERVPESDVFDLKAKLTLKNNDGNMKYS